MKAVTARERTSALVEALLRHVAVGGVVTASLALPGLAVGLDKPLKKLFDGLDEREQKRELRRVLRYMRQRDLIRYSKAERFENEVTISKKGRERLAKIDFNNISIPRPAKWDKKWRLVIFDIPEGKKLGRDSLTLTLHRLGFMPLQRSVWIHPFPCRDVIESVGLYHKLEKYVTYLETSYIDNSNKIKERFPKSL